MDAVTGEDYGITPGDPGAELWRTDPAYAASSPAYGPGSAFGVGVDRDTGVVNRIDLYSADIPTDGGVRIGDPARASRRRTRARRSSRRSRSRRTRRTSTTGRDELAPSSTSTR